MEKYLVVITLEGDLNVCMYKILSLPFFFSSPNFARKVRKKFKQFYQSNGIKMQVKQIQKLYANREIPAVFMWIVWI